MTHTSTSHTQIQRTQDMTQTINRIAVAATAAALLFVSMTGRSDAGDEWVLYGTPVLDSSFCEIVDQEQPGSPEHACLAPWADASFSSKSRDQETTETAATSEDLGGFDRDSSQKLASGPVVFVESDTCTFSESAKMKAAKAWSTLFTPNTGIMRSEAYKKRLSRQIFDFDFYAGLSGADYNGGHEDTNTCRNLSDFTDTLAYPRDFDYSVMGSYEGLQYWEELVDNDGVKDGVFPEVTNGATRFDANTHLGIQEVASNDDGGDYRNCRLSFPVSQIRSFSANPPQYWVEVGSYNAETTGDYEGVFTTRIEK